MTWKEINQALECEFVFADFREAMLFMQDVAVVVDKMDHHPEWTNIYNKVHIRLQTHSAGKVITDKDRNLAKAIDEIFQQYTT